MSGREIDIEGLRELEAKATPGPWDAEWFEWDWVVSVEENEQDADATFIVAARNALPSLLDSAAVLREIEKMRDELPPEDAGENSGTLWALHNNASFVLAEAERRARRAATEEDG